MHEPVMQSVASKLCKSSQKGEVLGIFNSSGYMGSFLGGVFGGFVMHKFGVNAIFVGVVICSVFWLIMLCFLENPANLSNLYLKKELVNFESLKNLALQNGFIESYEQNGVIVVKFNSKFISTKKVKEILKVSDE